MEFKDYYATLGVAKTATEKEIKQAFRKLARKHHPDVNPGDKAAEAKFKEINEAYEVLGDPAKRKKYDELGANWRHVRTGRGAGRRRTRSRGQWTSTWAAAARRGRLPDDDAGGDGGAVRGHEPVLRLLHDVLRRRRATGRRARARAAARASAPGATSSTRSS